MKQNEVWNVQEALQHLLAVGQCYCNNFHPSNKQTCYWCRALATWKSAEAEASAEPTDQQALAAIERICGDDFCEYAEIQLCTGGLSDDAKTAVSKLGDIYRISHSMVRALSCHHAHTDWRKTILEAKDGE